MLFMLHLTSLCSFMPSWGIKWTKSWHPYDIWKYFSSLYILWICMLCGYRFDENVSMPSNWWVLRRMSCAKKAVLLRSLSIHLTWQQSSDEVNYLFWVCCVSCTKHLKNKVIHCRQMWPRACCSQWFWVKQFFCKAQFANYSSVLQICTCLL